MNNNSFAKKVIKICKSHNSVAISGHQNPDYDALGSSLALREILRQNGIFADIILEQPLDNTFGKFVADCDFCTEVKKQYDVLITVDTSDLKLLPENVLGIKKTAKVTINIDHHQSNNSFADLNFVEPNKSSACEVLYWLFKKQFKLDKLLASYFYIGIYTDTGGFIYSNTQKDTFLCLGALMGAGLEAEKLLQQCFNKKSKSAFEITKRAFESVRFYCDNKVAVSILREPDFSATGANLNESKFIVPYLPTIEGVRVSISISEPVKNDFHVSLRTAFDDVDVSQIAKKFGGGGHKRASGMSLRGDFDKAFNALLLCTKNVLESKKE